MASSPIVWTPDKRMKLQAAAADLSPDAFQAVVGEVFGPATLAMRRRWSPRDVDFEGLEAASCESLTKALNEIHAQKHEPARRASVDSVPAARPRSLETPALDRADNALPTGSSSHERWFERVGGDTPTFQAPRRGVVKPRRLADDLSDDEDAAAPKRANDDDDAAPAPKRAKSRPPRWTADEEARLRTIVGELGDGDGREKWAAVAARLGTGRTDRGVEEKWRKISAAPPPPPVVAAPPAPAPEAPVEDAAAPPPSPQQVAAPAPSVPRGGRKVIEMRRIGDASWRRFNSQTDAAKAFGIAQSEVSYLINDRSKASGKSLLYEARRVAGAVSPPVKRRAPVPPVARRAPVPRQAKAAAAEPAPMDTAPPAPARPAPAAASTEPSRARRLEDDLSDDDAAPATTRPPRWTHEEEVSLRTLVGELGNGAWATIAARLGTGRTANGVEVKWRKLRAAAAAPPPPPPQVAAPPPVAAPAPALAPEAPVEDAAAAAPPPSPQQVAPPPVAARPAPTRFPRGGGRVIEMRRVGDASWRKFNSQTDASKAFGIAQSEISFLVNDRSKASGKSLLYEARRVGAAASEPPVARGGWGRAPEPPVARRAPVPRRAKAAAIVEPTPAMTEPSRRVVDGEVLPAKRARGPPKARQVVAAPPAPAPERSEAAPPPAGPLRAKQVARQRKTAPPPPAVVETAAAPPQQQVARQRKAVPPPAVVAGVAAAPPLQRIGVAPGDWRIVGAQVQDAEDSTVRGVITDCPSYAYREVATTTGSVVMMRPSKLTQATLTPDEAARAVRPASRKDYVQARIDSAIRFSHGGREFKNCYTCADGTERRQFKVTATHVKCALCRDGRTWSLETNMEPLTKSLKQHCGQTASNQACVQQHLDRLDQSVVAGAEQTASSVSEPPVATVEPTPTMTEPSRRVVDGEVLPAKRARGPPKARQVVVAAPPAPRPRPAPPRQTGQAPTLSPALKAQGWAVEQSRSTGGYYYVHTANGREWSQWEPPVAPAPERSEAAPPPAGPPPPPAQKPHVASTASAWAAACTDLLAAVGDRSGIMGVRGRLASAGFRCGKPVAGKSYYDISVPLTFPCYYDVAGKDYATNQDIPRSKVQLTKYFEGCLALAQGGGAYRTEADREADEGEDARRAATRKLQPKPPAARRAPVPRRAKAVEPAPMDTAPPAPVRPAPVAPAPAAPPAPAPAVAAPPPVAAPSVPRGGRKAIEMRRIGDASWRRFDSQTDASKAFGINQNEVSHLVNDRSKASGKSLLYEARRPMAAASEPPVARRAPVPRQTKAVEPTPAAPPPATKPSRARRLADDLDDEDDDAPAPKRAKSTRPPRWTSDEEARLRTLAGEVEGRDKWAVIAERLSTGRTANGVEVKWHKLKAKNAAAPPPPPVAPAPAPAAEQMVAKTHAGADSAAPPAPLRQRPGFAAPPPAPEAPVEEWRTEGSDLLGVQLSRTVNDGGAACKAVVVSWLSASDSDFVDADGRPAALYKIRYLDGDLAGDHQDLEAYEVEESRTAPRVPAPVRPLPGFAAPPAPTAPVPAPAPVRPRPGFAAPPAPEAPTAPTPAATDARREQQARLRALEKKRDATVLQDEDDWTPEECAYAQQMIDDFFAGLLELPVGTRLRAYVAEQLGCDPRRVGAKFEGQGAARRDDLFAQANAAMKTGHLPWPRREQVAAAARALEALRGRFLAAAAAAPATKRRKVSPLPPAPKS